MFDLTWKWKVRPLSYFGNKWGQTWMYIVPLKAACIVSIVDSSSECLYVDSQICTVYIQNSFKDEKC